MGTPKWLESAVRIGTSWIPGVGTAVDEGLERWEEHRRASAARDTLLDIEARRWRPDSSPAALLRADFGVVPFHGRQRELENLSEWCEGTGDTRKLPSGQTPPVALRLYTGPGGYGKPACYATSPAGGGMWGGRPASWGRASWRRLWRRMRRSRS